MRNHRVPMLISAAAIIAGALVTGATSAQAEVATLQVNGTYRPAVADWNKDGNSDILWYKPGAASHSMWYGTDHGMQNHTSGTTIGIPAGNYTPLVGYFNGTTTTSAIFYDPAKSLARWCQPSYLGPFCSDITVLKGAKPFVEDLDENGVDDILWYVPGVGADSIWYGSTIGDFSPQTFHMDGTTYQPLFVNADDKDGMDILWYAPGATADSLWLNNGKFGFTAIPQSIGGTYKPLVGSWNGPDYQDDILWYAPGAGADYLWRSNHNGTWTSASKTIGGPYEPHQFFANAFLMVNASGADQLWVATATGQDPTLQPTATAPKWGDLADLPGGVEPLRMHFKGDGGGSSGIGAIFWYGAGSIQDQQWYGIG